jgi:hypothetical protein
LGRLECLPPWESKSSPQKSVKSKRKKRDERKKKTKTWKVIERKRGERKKRGRRQLQPSFDHKKRTPKKILHKRVGVVLFPSTKGHLTIN